MITIFRNSSFIVISSFSLIFSQNYSLSFDGQSSYVSLPTNENLQLINNEITLTAWVKIPSNHIGNQYSTIIGGRSGFGFTLWAGGSFDNGAIRLNICCENPSEVSGNFDLRDDQWHFISVLYDGTKYKIYIDGNLDAESNEFSTNLTVYNGDDDIKIGIVNHEDANEFFHGKLDEIGFWNKALTNDEMINYSNNSPNGNEEGLVGYWDFNDGSGSTLSDLSVNGNNGTIYGATWSNDNSDPSVIYVPADYSTIQAGINAASDRDTVKVASGTYEENINFNGKNIVLIGEDKHNTIINGGLFNYISILTYINMYI